MLGYKKARLDKKQTLDLVNRASSAVSSLAVESSNVSVQAALQRLNSGQAELSTIHSSLQSMIQTHDAALQRLQNMEGATRQSG